MSKQRIGAAFWGAGQIRPGRTRRCRPHRPPAQRLYTLPPKEDSRSITYRELAEQVEMYIATVGECMRVLEEKGSVCRP